MDLIAEVDDILERHHRPAKAAMPALTAALAGAPPELRRDFAALAALLDAHLHKEEVILFPAIQALGRGDTDVGHHVLGPIAQMHVEHGQLHELEARLRAGLDRAGDATLALTAFLDDLALHAAREDETLFPHALARALDRPVAEIDLDELVAGVTGRADRASDPPPPRAARPTEPRSPRPAGRLRRALRWITSSR
ncbi:MAG: hemerythrin domain-containing protein [Alphaproteobacteria bacterium]|nr:hemerythrin domain-containing protein [Alphaproteobacteria bacterium]